MVGSDCQCLIRVLYHPRQWCWCGNYETLSRLKSPLTYVQVFPPANAIFTGIGVLLQVSIFLDQAFVFGNRYTLRLLRMSALARML